jgi:hypothetical protein
MERQDEVNHISNDRVREFQQNLDPLASTRFIVNPLSQPSVQHSSKYMENNI